MLFFDNELIEVDIGEGVTTIKKSAFGKNTIQKLTLPSSIERLHWYAFYDNNITELSWTDGGTADAWIDEYVFQKNSLIKFTIPSNVTEISDRAFADNNLTLVTFLGNRPGGSGDSIGDPMLKGSMSYGAFLNNPELSSIFYCESPQDGWPGERIRVKSPNGDIPGINILPKSDCDFDGVIDEIDSFPENALYSQDSDSDGMPDSWETQYGLNPNDPSDATSDQDNDGVLALDEFLAGTIPSGSLDIDGNGQYDALTDGLLLLRGMFGLDGSALVTGTVASDAAYTESVDIESRIATLGDLADIDGNGTIDALTDGLLTLRYLFGLEGETLIAGVVASDATRVTAVDIEAHLKTLMPAL
jgi:hypothetical protein